MGLPTPNRRQFIKMGVSSLTASCDGGSTVKTTQGKIEFFQAVIGHGSASLPAPMVAGRDGYKVRRKKLLDVVDGCGVSIPLETASAEYVGTGRQLAAGEHPGDILAALEAKVFRFDNPMAWIWNQPELIRLMKVFLWKFPDSPAIVWANRHFHGETFYSALSNTTVNYRPTLPHPLPAPNGIPFPWSVTLHLYPKGRSVEILPNRLKWVKFTDCSVLGSRCLASSKHRSEAKLPDGTISPTYREKVAIVARNSPLVSAARLTRLQVCRKPRTSGYSLAPSRVATRTRGVVPMTGWYVSDMNILKFTRLIEYKNCIGNAAIIAEELVFALERVTGRLLSLATQREPFASLACYDFDNSFPGRWLARNT